MSSAIHSFSLSHSGIAIRYERQPRGAHAV
jgi:hypothetical protein